MAGCGPLARTPFLGLSTLTQLTQWPRALSKCVHAGPALKDAGALQINSPNPTLSHNLGSRSFSSRWQWSVRREWRSRLKEDQELARSVARLDSSWLTRGPRWILGLEDKILRTADSLLRYKFLIPLGLLRDPAQHTFSVPRENAESEAGSGGENQALNAQARLIALTNKLITLPFLGLFKIPSALLRSVETTLLQDRPHFQRVFADAFVAATGSRSGGGGRWGSGRGGREGAERTTAECTTKALIGPLKLSYYQRLRMNLRRRKRETDAVLAEWPLVSALLGRNGGTARVIAAFRDACTCTADDDAERAKAGGQLSFRLISSAIERHFFPTLIDQLDLAMKGTRKTVEAFQGFANDGESVDTIKAHRWLAVHCSPQVVATFLALRDAPTAFTGAADSVLFLRAIKSDFKAAYFAEGVPGLLYQATLRVATGQTPAEMAPRDIVCSLRVEPLSASTSEQFGSNDFASKTSGAKEFGAKCPFRISSVAFQTNDALFL